MSQLNDPVELMQQTRSNFMIESDVSNISHIKKNMQQLTNLMAEKQKQHEELTRRLQGQLKIQQSRVQALKQSFEEQKCQVERVEDELNIPKLEQEIETLIQEISTLRETIQNGISKVVETQKQLLSDDSGSRTENQLSKEDRVRVLKLKLFHSLDLTFYQDQLLDLRNDAQPLPTENLWEQL